MWSCKKSAVQPCFVIHATGLAGAARGMLAQRDDTVIRSLETIRVPTLVLVGANDTHCLAATDYMASKIPGSIEVVIPTPSTPPTSTNPQPSTARWMRSWPPESQPLR